MQAIPSVDPLCQTYPRTCCTSRGKSDPTRLATPVGVAYFWPNIPLRNSRTRTRPNEYRRVVLGPVGVRRSRFLLGALISIDPERMRPHEERRGRSTAHVDRRAGAGGTSIGQRAHAIRDRSIEETTPLARSATPVQRLPGAQYFRSRTRRPYPGPWTTRCALVRYHPNRAVP
jgi:hypothetical protein